MPSTESTRSPPPPYPRGGNPYSYASPSQSNHYQPTEPLLSSRARAPVVNEDHGYYTFPDNPNVKPSRKSTIIRTGFTFAILAVLLIIAVEIRHNLSSEMEQHWKDHERWDREQTKWTIDRNIWKREHSVEEEKRRKHREELQRWAEDRNGWAHDKQVWEGEREQQVENRQHWTDEKEGWRQERESWKEHRAKEEERREKMREEEKQWLIDADERLRYRKEGMYWDEPKPKDHCSFFGTREYSARIWGVPGGFSWEKACRYLPIVIHNRVIETPNKCENQGRHGTYGYWTIDFDEYECKPYWDAFEDTDCSGVGTGMRRFEARLRNAQNPNDWLALCASTSAVINGVNYTKPTYCENRGTLRGMTGIWDVEDRRC